MALFLATHTNKVDAKGRLSVPATFRNALAANEFQGVVLVPSTKFPALEGFSMNMMQELSARLDKFDLFSDTQDDLASVIFANAVPLSFDDTGRITMPKELLGHAKIKENAVFVGLGTKFQIWEPRAYEARQKQAAEHVQENKLTVPSRGENS
jgi:MraZ protein